MKIQIYYYSQQNFKLSIEDAKALLSSDERTKAERFVFEKDQQTAIFSRAGLRLVLGQQLGCHPSALEFGKNSQGKPFLTYPATELKFNVTHSGDFIAYAIAQQRELGIDLEKISESFIDGQLIARQLFHPDEIALLNRAYSLQDKTHLFLNLWTQKEAYVKGIGCGIMASQLNQWAFVPNSSSYLPCNASPYSHWKIQPLNFLPGYSSALAFQVHIGAPEPSIAYSLI